MIIDAHTHGFHGQYMDLLYDAGGQWARNALSNLASVTRNKPQFTDVNLRVEQLKRCGIDLQVVTIQHYLDSNALPGESAVQLKMARAINDHMARLQADSQGKILATGSVPLAVFEQGGRQEMERAVKNLGLRAIAIPSNFNGKPPDLPEYEPFWATCAQMKVPVYIHPSDSVGRSDRRYEAEYDMMHNFGWPFETELILSRLVFSGIMEKYPDLKVMSHHLGGGIPFLWGRINETYDPVNQQRTIGRTLPKPLFDYFSLFYYDTAVGGNGAAIKCTYDIFGADHIIFATDAPWGPGTGENRLIEYPQVVRSLGLSDEETEKILSGNIKKILNLK